MWDFGGWNFKLLILWVDINFEIAWMGCGSCRMGLIWWFSMGAPGERKGLDER